MPQAFTYKDAERILQRAGRRGNLGANTTIRREGDDIVVRLYNTDIIHYHPSDAVTLNSGGHRTVTTKGRINGFLAPYIHVSQVKGEWFVGHGRFLEDTDFFDGITVYPDGTVVDMSGNYGYRGQFRQNGAQRNPPRHTGKFLDTVEEMVYGCDHDQQAGSVDENGWYGMVSGLLLPDAVACAMQQDIDMHDFNNDVQQYNWPLNAIIRESGDGSITMETFKNNRDMMKVWRKVEESV